jgi:hypothetical protein
MAQPAGFAFRRLGDAVVVTHHGKKAATLRGAAAARFLDEVEGGDPQLVMARTTRNYKRGNERTARSHPRNR